MDDKERIYRRWMFGLGLDCNDGELRMTRGPNFHLLGGSEPTHERMQETCVLFNEELRRRGKTLETVGPEEAREIIRQIEERFHP